MRLQDNKKGCRVKKNYSLMLYQRVTGDFYTINSEGKFTLPKPVKAFARAGFIRYNGCREFSEKRCVTWREPTCPEISGSGCRSL